ncbi:MAG TPA: hypothetical protein ENI26_01580 [Methylophaga aminisulfidivorans]|uniref:Uncharacterized protein n=2 Tax=root TaxID=1 RepID=A0A7C1VNZ3_9GAMM|nr:hypothetical protein [Methylophaga aminisulfidivorans]HEC73042.1 hypothetical protein [Methylophaga aminisulfidivorans]
MADKQTKQPIDDNVKDAEISETNQAGQKKNTEALIWIALLIVILLSVGSIAWFYQQLLQQQTEVDSAVDKQSTELSSLTQQHRQQFRQLNEQQQQLSDRLDEIANKKQFSNAELMKKWALQEVKYLLDIANQRALLAHDVTGAIQALSIADKQLESIADYKLHPLRALIAEEIMSLQSLASLDVTGMAIQLQVMANHVNDLRVKKGPEVTSASSDDLAVTASSDTPAWKQAISDIWQQLRSMVVIRHEQTGEAAVLVPEQRYFLYQNLRLQLESARLALLNADESSYKHSLSTTIDWLNHYFTGQQRDAMVNTLTNLSETDITIAIPDISGSLNWLEEYQQ